MGPQESGGSAGVLVGPQGGGGGSVWGQRGQEAKNHSVKGPKWGREVERVQFQGWDDALSQPQDCDMNMCRG